MNGPDSTYRRARGTRAIQINSNPRPGPRYEQSVTWHDIRGNSSTVTIDDCDTQAEATSKAVSWAKEQGWTAPRWWQWWRWADTRPVED